MTETVPNGNGGGNGGRIHAIAEKAATNTTWIAAYRLAVGAFAAVGVPILIGVLTWFGSTLLSVDKGIERLDGRVNEIATRLSSERERVDTEIKRIDGDRINGERRLDGRIDDLAERQSDLKNWVARNSQSIRDLETRP